MEQLKEADMQLDAAQEPRMNDAIKHIWHRLTDAEIEAREEYRDIFFLAVRKKHGVARAQAQLFLSELEHKLDEAA